MEKAKKKNVEVAYTRLASYILLFFLWTGILIIFVLGLISFGALWPKGMARYFLDGPTENEKKKVEISDLQDKMEKRINDLENMLERKNKDLESMVQSLKNSNANEEFKEQC